MFLGICDSLFLEWRIIHRRSHGSVVSFRYFFDCIPSLMSWLLKERFIIYGWLWFAVNAIVLDTCSCLISFNGKFSNCFAGYLIETRIQIQFIERILISCILYCCSISGRTGTSAAVNSQIYIQWGRYTVSTASFSSASIYTRAGDTGKIPNSGIEYVCDPRSIDTSEINNEWMIEVEVFFFKQWIVSSIR